MANEGLFALIGLLVLGGGRMQPARPAGGAPTDGFPPTVRPKDDTGGTPVPGTTARTVPDPTTSSTATISPGPDNVGALANFGDLRLTENEVVIFSAEKAPRSFVEGFIAGTTIVDVPIPGAAVQQIRVLTFWTTLEEAQKAFEEAKFQQRTYPLGDPLWVHHEAVKIATTQFIIANAPELGSGMAFVAPPPPTTTQPLVVVNGQVTVQSHPADTAAVGCTVAGWTKTATGWEYFNPWSLEAPPPPGASPGFWTSDDDRGLFWQEHPPSWPGWQDMVCP